MSEVLTGSIQVAVNGVLTGGPNLGIGSFNLNYPQVYGISNGTGQDQANMIWSSTRTITASSSENLDLAGVLTDNFGTTITFTKIRGIIVKAAAANTNNVLVGGAGSNTFLNWVGDATDIIVVRPGGMFMTYANDPTAFAVTASTGDILKVANSSSGTSVVYDIIIIGCV